MREASPHTPHFRFLIISTALLMGMLAPTVVAAGPTVMLVHDEVEPMNVLAAALEVAGYDALVQNQEEFSDTMGRSEPEAVFMYVHGDILPQVEDALIRYADEGGRLIVLHHGVASAKVRSRRWLPFVGVAILPRDHATHPWRVLRGNVQVVNLRPDHYVTTHNIPYPETVSYRPSDEPSTAQNLPGFTLADTEMFLNQHFTDGRRKTVLLGSQVKVEGKIHAQDRAGWMMPAGKGHVFYFQQGHRAEDFENAVFTQILLNAVSWKP